MNIDNLKNYVKENLNKIKKYEAGSPYDGETISYTIGNKFVVTYEDDNKQDYYQLRFKSEIDESLAAREMFELVQNSYNKLHKSKKKNELDFVKAFHTRINW